MRGKLGKGIGTVAAASAVMLSTAGCSPQSSAKADIDPTDGNWYEVGIDFTSAWGEVVTWDGGPDLSGVDWDVDCQPNEYYAVFAYGSTNSAADPYISIRIDDDGAVEQLQAAGSSDSYDNFLWYSSAETSRMPTKVDPGKVVFEGDRVVVKGQAFQYSDFEYATPINFEVRLTCDSWN
ncbi:hypothetical protein [Gulosibacter sp. ACHW.36C]|uniref:Lipoprotein n=1 Tax=Gulosibacter sediminis TaxID=1729695 RepID=A0ABY4MYL4_9MICO|nr:hypothetical protein [Gulosibacter sediminis]UQN15531.1 hypothetical protein M3M28_03465 [Gulosibacter sediminis]